MQSQIFVKIGTTEYLATKPVGLVTLSANSRGALMCEHFRSIELSFSQPKTELVF